MLPTKEKGRPGEGSPIPKFVLTDATDSKSLPLNLQISRLCRLHAVNATMAAMIAPLIFGEVVS
jgi:hypothetical protein